MKENVKFKQIVIIEHLKNSIYTLEKINQLST